MKIILKEDIVNLGFKNDVVEVKNGWLSWLPPAHSRSTPRTCVSRLTSWLR